MEFIIKIIKYKSNYHFNNKSTVLQWHAFVTIESRRVDALWPAQVTDGLKYNGQPPNKFNSKRVSLRKGEWKEKRMRQLYKLEAIKGFL